MFYSLGMNQYGVSKRLNKDNYYDSLHAEMDAMNKLLINKKNKMIKINIFVFRISRSKKRNLMLAKCCDNCYKGLYSIAKQKNYKIKNIFFTNNEGVIEKYI